MDMSMSKALTINLKALEKNYIFWMSAVNRAIELEREEMKHAVEDEEFRDAYHWLYVFRKNAEAIQRIYMGDRETMAHRTRFVRNEQIDNTADILRKKPNLFWKMLISALALNEDPNFAGQMYSDLENWIIDLDDLEPIMECYEIDRNIYPVWKQGE